MRFGSKPQGNGKIAKVDSIMEKWNLDGMSDQCSQDIKELDDLKSTESKHQNPKSRSHNTSSSECKLLPT